MEKTQKYKKGELLSRIHIMKDMMDLVPDEIFIKKPAPGYENSWLKTESSYLNEDIEVTITIKRLKNNE